GAQMRPTVSHDSGLGVRRADRQLLLPMNHRLLAEAKHKEGARLRDLLEKLITPAVKPVSHIGLARQEHLPQGGGFASVALGDQGVLWTVLEQVEAQVQA